MAVYRGCVTDAAAAAAAIAVVPVAAQLTLGKILSQTCRGLGLTCNCVKEK